MIGRLQGDFFDEGFFDDLVEKDQRLRTTALLFSDPDGGLNRAVTVAELRAALKRVKRGKAAGLDGIPGELLRLLPDVALGRILNLFNCILLSCTVPAQWWLSTVTLILKPGKNSSYSPAIGRYPLLTH
eukprot:Lithocolla_globosa_v1_NODE_3375_length_1687_cov_19.176471.p2 type:complete len:129 gc:universal NODE_3375_length_1687_cov_19.176471:1502-1116(-)